MKKFFFFAACLMSASMYAAAPTVEFVANLGEGDKITTTSGETTILPASGDTKDTKYTVAAGTVLVSNSKLTVKNAFAVDYKNVGMEATDSTYLKLMVGNTEIPFTGSAIQGQSNPSPNPVAGIDTKATPNAGACYLVDVKQDGWLLVAVKATPNKNQFCMENYTNAGAAIAANSLEYRYALMTHNTTGTAIGNPDGCLQTYFMGNSESGYILASALQPYQLYSDYTGSAYSKNGPGFMLVEVFKDGSPYLVGTAGSKMMAAGFAWISDTTDLVITAKGSATGKGGQGGPYADVQLWPYGANAQTQDCGTKEETFNITFNAPAEWVADTLDTKEGVNFKKVYAKVTDAVNGTKSFEMGCTKDTINNRVYAKDGKYTYAYKTKATSYDVEFTITAQPDATYPTATTKESGLTADACFTAGAVSNNLYTLVACGATDVEETEEVKVNKVIENGQLFLIKNGVRYNATGAVVK